MLELLISKFKVSIKNNRASFKVRDNRVNKLFLNLVWEEKLIMGYRKEKGSITVSLKHTVWGKSVVKGISLLSKKGRRNYIAYFELERLLRYQNRIYLISTVQGVMPIKKAKTLGIGGELLFYIRF